MQRNINDASTDSGSGHLRRLLQQIHRRAYEIHRDRENSGQPGSEADDWATAEREVALAAGLWGDVFRDAERARSVPEPEDQKVAAGARPLRFQNAEDIIGVQDLADLPTSPDDLIGDEPQGDVERRGVQPRDAREGAGVRGVDLSALARAWGQQPVATGMTSLLRLTAGDIMTSRVTVVEPECPVTQLVAILDEHGISGVPVVDRDHRLLGVVSTTDVMRHIAETDARASDCLKSTGLTGLVGQESVIRGRIAGELAARSQVGQILRRGAVTVGSSARISEVATLMSRHEIHRVLVVDGGKLVGIVSALDLVRTLCNVAETAGVE